MMVLAAMMLVYGICCFGEMKKLAILYFVLACINAAIYPIFSMLDTTEDSPWLTAIYGYGIAEEFLKLSLLLRFTRFKHQWLIILSFLHMVNNAFNEFHYGFFNDALIFCEMSYFIWRSSGVVNSIYNKLRPRNIRELGAHRRVS